MSALLAFAFVLQGAAGGTWSAPTDNGGELVLTLTPGGRGAFTGRLTGNGVTFAFQGQLRQGVLTGIARNGETAVHLAITRQADALDLTLSELDAAGQPNPAASRRIAMTRVAQQAADTAQRRPGLLQRLGNAISDAAKQPASGNGQPASGPVATTPQDQQIVQLLSSRNWCYMRYSQAMGSTSTERVAFSADGRWAMATGRETALNTQSGSYYGNSNGAMRGTFRVQNGVLLMTENGMQWEQYPLRIYQNSNGYPIVNANGKEYSGC